MKVRPRRSPKTVKRAVERKRASSRRTIVEGDPRWTGARHVSLFDGVYSLMWKLASVEERVRITNSGARWIATLAKTFAPDVDTYVRGSPPVETSGSSRAEPDFEAMARAL